MAQQQGEEIRRSEILLKLHLRSYLQMDEKMMEPMSASDHKCNQYQNVVKFVGFIRNLISEKKHNHFLKK